MHYFDCAATYAPFEGALECYENISRTHFGNPSSVHGFGNDALRILEDSKRKILESFGLFSTHDCIFTSGATESNNLALKGFALRYQNRGKRILTSCVEHPSVLEPLKSLEKMGFQVEFLPVNEAGIVEPAVLEKAMGNDVVLVSIMGVNNETGAIFPLKDYLSITSRFPKTLFHSDLTQAIGKVEMPLNLLDSFSFSGHKIGGLKGTGALILSKKRALVPQLDGGGQQNGFRSGTVDVAGAASLAYAVVKSRQEEAKNLQKETERAAYLKSKLSSIPEIVWNTPDYASPYILNFSLSSHKASVIVEGLSQKDFYVSSVSACSSKKEPVSEVLTAMGRCSRLAGNSIRISLPPEVEVKELDEFVETLKCLLDEVRPL